MGFMDDHPLHLVLLDAILTHATTIETVSPGWEGHLVCMRATRLERGLGCKEGLCSDSRVGPSHV